VDDEWRIRQVRAKPLESPSRSLSNFLFFFFEVVKNIFHNVFTSYLGISSANLAKTISLFYPVNI